MEKTDNCYCMKGDFIWSDVGSWKTLFELLEKDNDNNVIEGKSLSHNAKNNLIISPDKLTAVVGLDNVAVINIDGAPISSDIELNYQFFTAEGMIGNGMMQLRNPDEFNLYQN